MLEEIVRGENNFFCTKHDSTITYDMVVDRRCYTGNRGKTYCRYARYSR